MSSSLLPRSMSLPAPLTRASSSSSLPDSTSPSPYTPEQAAAAKAARRASMLDYARRVRRDEHAQRYADHRAAAVRFLSPLPHLHHQSSGSIGSSTEERAEDPFSLSGFFPSRPGSPRGRAVSSAWLGDDEAEVEAEERAYVPQKKSLSMSALDDYAKSVIAREGQVGILSYVPSFLSNLTLNISTPISKETINEEEDAEHDEDGDEAYDPDLRTPSIDEPYDAESLLASHTGRRSSSSSGINLSALAIPAASSPSSGFLPPSISLFSPTKEADDALELQLSHLSLGWADSLYSRLIAPVL